MMVYPQSENNLTIKQNKKFKMPTQKNPKTEQKKDGLSQI